MATSFNFNDLDPHDDQANPSSFSPQLPSSSSTTAAANTSTDSPTAPGGHRSGNVTVYQTTGPDAHTGPILSPGTETPAINPRSCVTCRRRKVRCDKQMPCSNCRRGYIPCVFPAPGRAPRRPKDPAAPPKNSSQREVELIKRLRKLEGIVEELSEQVEVESGGKDGSSTNSPTGGAHGEHHGGNGHARSSMSTVYRNLSDGRNGQRTTPSPKNTDSASEHGSDGRPTKDVQRKFGRLFIDERKGSARYVSSGFWSKINDELDAIREETQKLSDEDDSDFSDIGETPIDSPASALVQDHHSFVVGYRSADVNLQQCHPSPSQMPYLWSIYKENVDPLVKVLHVPSVEETLQQAKKNLSSLTPGNEALLFAIYFSAVVSSEPEDILRNLGSDKDTLLSRYRFSVEQAMARANFLNNPDLATIQAFTLFLTTVRREDDTRFCWTMTSLLIRIAQGMGLHRDGFHLGLSPFETEMRRRIWWAILMLDVRSSEELGTDPVIGMRSFDAEIPANINDADFDPKCTKIPESREGSSDTAVAVLRCEICDVVRRFLNSGAALTTASVEPISESSIAEREEILVELYERVENKFLKHLLNDTGSLYWAAAMLARIIMGKMTLVLYQPLLFSSADEQLSDEVRQRAFVAAVEVTEYGHKLNMDPRCKQYHWLFRTYVNWHAIAYTLLEAARRPWTAMVERGWAAVTNFRKSPSDVTNKHSESNASVFLPLRKLYLRARKHRTAEIARLRANPDEARRLDFQERTCPMMSRFGPVPGDESQMENIRGKWRALMRPDGAATVAQGPGPDMRFGNGPAMSSSGPPLGPLPSMAQMQSQQPMLAPTTGPMDISSAAMEFMDDFMSNPSAVQMSSFWPVTDAAVDASSRLGIAPEDLVSPTDFHGQAQPASLPLQQQQQQNLATMQGAMQQTFQQQQPPRTSFQDDDLPPYLWSHPYGGAETKMDEDPSGDLDMLGDDFDWQVWSQNLRGMEMGGTTQY